MARRPVGASALAIAAIAGLLWSGPSALAACATVGTTVVCTGATMGSPNGFGTGAEDGLTIDVVAGASVTGDDNGIFVRHNNVINNAGTITGLPPDGVGILANDDSLAGPIALTVNNASTGTITGELNGIVVYNVAGDSVLTVTNFGTISATGAGGFQAAIAGNIVHVTNHGTIEALGAGSDGIDAFFGAGIGNISNYGTITADTNAISIAEGTVVNYASGTISQTGMFGYAVSILNGSLTNHGTIDGASEINAAVAITSGSVVNFGTINSARAGVEIADGTVINSGTINGTADFASGIEIGAGGPTTVTNTGNIIADGLFGSGILVGIGATATIDNSGRIQANGDIGTGLNIDGTATVTNRGIIVADGPDGVAVFVCNCGVLTLANSGTIQANGDSGIGIQVSSGGSGTIVNSGTIVATGPGGTGIQGDAGSILDVTNSGTIEAGQFGIFGNDDAIVSNSGTISIAQPSGTVVTVGNLAALPASPNVFNSGTLTAGDDSSGIVAGENNFIVNSGTIRLGQSTGFGSQSGIMADAGSRIVNSGTIETGAGTTGLNMTGILALGVDVAIENSGLISVGNSASGIATLADNTRIANTGTILAHGGTGILIAGGTAGAEIDNSGHIIANTSNGIGGIGVNFQDNSGTLNNTGMIRALGIDSVAINTCAPTCGIVVTITNAGTVDGLLALDNGATFANTGLLTITATDAGMPVGASAHIAGDLFDQSGGGTLAVRVTADNRNDSLGTAAGGNVILGGTLRALVQPGLYDDATTYINVVTSANDIGTVFANVDSSSPFFIATAIYNLQSVDLGLARVPFGSVPGLTPNQQAVGNALEASYATTLTGNAATLYGNLLAATSVTALDNISGEGTSATQNAAFGAGSLFNNAMQGQGLFGPNGAVNGVLPLSYAEADRPRGHEAFAALKAPARAGAEEARRWRVWLAGFGARRGFDGEASTGSSDQSVRSFGGALGVERRHSHDLTYGFAVGGSDSTFSVDSLSTSGSTTGGHIGAYAVKTWGALYAAASLGYAHFENDTRRTIAGVGPTETATGRFGSDQFGARIELGHRHTFGRSAVTPFAAIEPAVLRQQSYTETSTTAGGGAGVLGLTVASRTATSLPAFVGVQVDGRHVLANGARLTPHARISWVHEFLPDRRVTATFISVPSATFTVDGARAARDAARLDAGVKLELRPGRSLFANASGEWSGRTDSLSASGGYRTVW